MVHRHFRRSLIFLWTIVHGLWAPLHGELRRLRDSDFICHGRAGRSETVDGRTYEDCGGGHLPKAGVQPALLKLLNKFQAEVGKPVVVTSGYRCEAHNLYSWAAVARETGDRQGVSLQSLHRAGAAADFYVEGVRDLAEYRRYEKVLKRTARPVRHPAIWTHVYGPTDVRDPDNRHDYPYIHVHLLGVKREALPPF